MSNGDYNTRYYRENRERKLAYAKEYRDKNRDLIREKQREYHKRHIEERREANRQYRIENSGRLRVIYRDKQLRNHAPKIALVRDAKDMPCADCGQSFPHYVMDFDHVRGVKVNSVSQMTRSNRYTLEQIADEIAKCEVVCANCHRVRTHGRNQYESRPPKCDAVSQPTVESQLPFPD